MFKKLIISACFLSFILPAFAEKVPNQEALNYVNANPKFSGATNSARMKYPALKQSLSASDMMQENAENEMNAKSDAREIKLNPRNIKQPPMNYSNFPQNYDSSNSMMMMQGGMQNMFMQ